MRCEWVYNIVKEILENNRMEITLLHQTLLFINSILEDCKTHEEKVKTKYLMKAHGIGINLLNLSKHKNSNIGRKSEYLLNTINT
jgi:hypothetical protein